MQTCWISQCSISKAFKMRWRWVKHLHHDQIEMMAKSQWQMVVLLIAGLPLIFTWYCLSISYRNSTKKWKIVPVDAKNQPHDCVKNGSLERWAILCSVCEKSSLHGKATES
jgi:hypothetical protein